MTALTDWVRRRIPVETETLVAFGSEPVPEHLKHWWWCLGGTPAYLFIVQVVTGILLAFHYVPDPDRAYESVQYISDQLPYGWYVRSVHRWSSHFMIVAVVLHLLRVFFTGGYRAPREMNWMVGCGLLLTTLLFAFTGYSLVNEQLSYWGATVGANITASVPVIGPTLADFMRGGDKVGAATLTRFFVFHIGALPTLLIGLLVAHLTMIRLHGVTDLRFKKSPSQGRTFPFFPDHFLTELGIGLTLMFLMTVLAIVFPAGLQDKANPLVTPEHIKPEWYFFFTFRWLKLTSLGFAVLSLGLAGFLMAMWPFVDQAFRRRRPRELSMLFGALAFFAVIALTVWEVLALFYSH